jgi:Nif-specific regulatory protein
MEKSDSVEMSVLYRISQAVAHRRDIPALLQEVFDILEKDMGMSYGTLTLRRPDTDVFVIEASRGLTPEEHKRGQYRLGEGITGSVAKSGKAEIVLDISKDPRFLNRTRSRKGAPVAFVCVPIIHQRQVIGTISIDRPAAEKAQLTRDQEFLRLVTNLLAEAVASIRQQIVEQEGLKAENERLRRQLGDKYQPHNLVGNSKEMRAVYDQVAQVADSAATVLIRGETGTGKELVARAIHFGSSRRGSPFVSVNCAALPENLIESELFGHEKGSWTLRAGQRGDAVSGRDWRHHPGGSGPPAAGPAGTFIREGGRRPSGGGQCAGDCGHQPESGGGDPGEPVPRGSLLPAQCFSHPHAALARAQG